jgi:hypothetical protein
MKSVKSLLTTVFLAGLLAGVPDVALATDPVSPNASPEAKALLDLFYRISGKYTLTGQHNEGPEHQVCGQLHRADPRDLEHGHGICRSRRL